MSEISETEIKAMTKEQNYLRGYKDGKSDVLDMIRAEIMSKDGLEEALEIIDKYKRKVRNKE